MGAGNAKADARRYRDGYPGQQDDPHSKDNAQFYTGAIRSRPQGDFIDNIHQKWFGDYDLLEEHHGYVQWLFPIREDGVNMQASPLQLHEIATIKADPKGIPRVMRSYELMLDFYGMRLKDPVTGEVERSANYRPQYHNLNTSFHNYLRVTRILKCLGEFGLEHLKRPWIEFLVHECFVTKALVNIKESLCNYWISVLRNDDERHAMQALIKSHGGSPAETDDEGGDDDDDDDDDDDGMHQRRRRGVHSSRYDDDADDYAAADDDFAGSASDAPRRRSSVDANDADGLTAMPRRGSAGRAHFSEAPARVHPLHPDAGDDGASAAAASPHRPNATDPTTRESDRTD